MSIHLVNHESMSPLSAFSSLNTAFAVVALLHCSPIDYLYYVSARTKESPPGLNQTSSVVCAQRQHACV